MKEDINIDMYKTITGWGIPNIDKLKDRDIKFIFDEKDIPNKKYCGGLHCGKSSVKFGLYDSNNKKIIFVMDFFERNWLSRKKKPQESLFIKLGLLNVLEPGMRNKGIATYYLKKLNQYAIEKQFAYIEVYPDTKNEVFKGQDFTNSLQQQDLEEFYRRILNSKVPIKFIKGLNVKI